MLMEANDGGKIFDLADQEVSEMTGLSTGSISRHLKELGGLKLVKEINKARKQSKINGQYKELKPKDYKIYFGYSQMNYEEKELYRFQDRREMFRGMYNLSR
jgi:DNA-binding transcriptional ArsR family regulator